MMKPSTDPRAHTNQYGGHGELRCSDIRPLREAPLTVTIDGREVPAYPDETVLSVLYSLGQKAISKNDRGIVTGAYCGMGICYSCMILVNGQKQRACCSIVRPGMRIETCKSLLDAYEEEARQQREEQTG